MKRVVFDTNIIISGYLWSGAPQQALLLASQKQVQLIASEAMLDELRDVLQRSKFAPRLTKIGMTVQQILENYLTLVEIIELSEILPIVEADADDDVIIACAVKGEADWIVSGDPHLLELKQHQQITILDVNTFLDNFIVKPEE